MAPAAARVGSVAGLPEGPGRAAQAGRPASRQSCCLPARPRAGAELLLLTSYDSSHIQFAANCTSHIHYIHAIKIYLLSQYIDRSLDLSY
eukprot:COSAG01_NODE_2114_length_8392_cov_6.483058_1_plen_90_part_00